MARKQFTTEIRAAKIAARFGWNSLSEEDAGKKALEPVAWRITDSANLARIAAALEQIARKMPSSSRRSTKVDVHSCLEAYANNY